MLQLLSTLNNITEAKQKRPGSSRFKINTDAIKEFVKQD